MRSLRAFIGGVFLLSALGKSLDVPGFVGVLATYQALPAALLWPVAWAVILTEWFMAAWVLSGWRVRWSAIVSAWINGAYAVWMTVSLLRGLTLANCGCFGVFFPQPLRWYSPLEDLVLVGLCVALARRSRATRSRR